MSLSFQLYSARSLSDQYQLLKDLSELGYKQVEGYQGNFDNPEHFKAALDEAGLSMPSAHISIEALESDLDEQMTLCKTLEMRQVYVPYLAEEKRPNDSEGYKSIAKRLRVLASKVHDQGLSLGWHNHDFEMTALNDGSIPMEVLLNEAPEITWEADLAWVAYAKADPTEYLTQWGSRISAVHAKDLAAAGEKQDEDGWADVGEGVMGWQALSAKVRECAPDALVVMEHDNPSDVMRFASTSIKNYNSY